MGVQPHAVRPGQHRALPHQVAGHAERRTRRQRHVYHAEALPLVIRLDRPPAVCQDRVLFLHAGVRRQPALRLAQAHAAARRREADAQLDRGLDFVVDLRAVRVHIQVIARRGAARQHQLGQPDLRRRVDRLRPHPRPDRVQRLEPVEQNGILRDAAGQRLVQVMVRVHQARQHDHPGRVDDRIRGLGQLGRWPRLLDCVVAHEQAAPGDLAPLRIHRDQQIRILQK